MGVSIIANRQPRTARAAGEDGRVARDVVLVLAALVAVTAAAVAADGIDGRVVVALLVAAPVAATVFAYRRHREAASARHQLAALSMVDPLTGLPNRRALPECYSKAIERATRTMSPVAVLFVDLDRFARVNETFGTEVGDRVIVTVAERLRAAVKLVDRVVRYSSDEFAIICNDVVTTPTVVRIAERVLEVVSDPIDVDGSTVTVSASVGIALADNERSTMDQVLSTASSALARAKAAGGGTCTMLEPGRAEDDDRQRLLDELRQALDLGQFVLHYQPVVSMADKSMIGVEALLRWQHPDRGLLLPGMFVEELEESGLIVPVGAWVLETACRQARLWQDAHPDRPFVVAINLSGHQLSDPNFSAFVLDTLRTTGVRPSRLCFEITESAIMNDIDGAWATLRAAKDRGVQLALDDFGTGYSSLSYLRRFKTDVLKIDRTFVEGLGRGDEDAAIVEHVIGLAHALGMTTVAEGIEREDQYEQLLRFDCDQGQGFWFAQAQPLEIINQLLDLTSHAFTGSAAFRPV